MWSADQASCFLEYHSVVYVTQWRWFRKFTETRQTMPLTTMYWCSYTFLAIFSPVGFDFLYWKECGDWKLTEGWRHNATVLIEESIISGKTISSLVYELANILSKERNNWYQRRLFRPNQWKSWLTEPSKFFKLWDWINPLKFSCAHRYILH